MQDSKSAQWNGLDCSTSKSMTNEVAAILLEAG